jgi:hypothetical protein
VEHHSHLQAAELGLDREADLVTGPHNVLGIELNEYAAELARVTVWIGELQWRMAHGYEFKTNPVLDTAGAHRMPRCAADPHGLPNSDVLKPWANGFELSRGPQHQWIIDFGNALSEEEASLYERPFADVVARIKPERINKTDVALRDFWWRFGRPRVEMRTAFKPLHRFIATVAHSKHRFFVWLPVTTSPDQALITVARADDTTFGILHSRFHELWSLRMGTSLEDRPTLHPHHLLRNLPLPRRPHPDTDTAHQRLSSKASSTPKTDS